MATIPGSQYGATAGSSVHVGDPSATTALPGSVSGDFNLEAYVGSLWNAPSLGAGYQGLAVLSPSGLELDLVSGAFAITDNGSGNDTISAYGDAETVSGGGANVTINLYGSGDVANGGGQDTISVAGNADTVNGVGNDLIIVTGSNDTINGGSGNDTIDVLLGSGNVVNGNTGNQLINVFANADTVNGGSGNDTINAVGSGDLINASSGNNTIVVAGNFDTVNGAGNDTVVAAGWTDLISGGAGGNNVITVAGQFDTVNGGSGNATDTINFAGSFGAVNISGADTVNIVGSEDTVTAGAQAGTNQGLVNMAGTGMTIADGSHQYADTVVGFEQSSGDTIHLAATDTVATSTQVNGGTDTMIKLSDGSSILLKGITHVDPSFFS